MIDRTLARRIVAEHIEEGCRSPDGFTPVILDDKTIERPFGWVFFYEAREFLDTGDHRSRLAGNAPLIVDRETGEIHPTGTAHPVDYYVNLHEKAQRGRR